MLTAYRRSGADLPFGDPRGYHGVGMEGYFWRVTDARAGVVAVVLVGVNRDERGRSWGTVGLASHPSGRQRVIVAAQADAARHGVGVIARDDGRVVCEATDEALSVDLGPGARLRLTVDRPARWPRRAAFGGIGAAQMIPGLSQYWHPHLLGGRARGVLQLGDVETPIDGTVYGEKNWSHGGFPRTWWWGQAHGFEDQDVSVAFAGGRAGAAGLRVTGTALVVGLGGDVLRFVRPFVPIGIDVGDGGWRLAARGPVHRVLVEGHANGTAPHMLPVPVPAERRNLEGAAAQHLAGQLRLRVRRGRRLVYDGVSSLAGLERGHGPRTG